MIKQRKQESDETSKPCRFKRFTYIFKKLRDTLQWSYTNTLTYTHCLGNLTTSTITENTTELLSTAAHEIFAVVLEVKGLCLFQIATTAHSTQQRALMVYR